MKFEVTLADATKFTVSGDRIQPFDGIWTVYSDNVPVAYFCNVAAVIKREEAEDMPIVELQRNATLEDKEIAYIQGTIDRLTGLPPQSWKTPVADLPTGREPFVASYCGGCAKPSHRCTCPSAVTNEGNEQ